MRIEQAFDVAARPDRVWAFLMDVPAMAQCIPGASDVQPVDETSFDARVTTRIGPVTANFGCRIVVLELDQAARTGTVEVSGRDSRIGGAVKAKMTLSLAPAETGTTVQIRSDVDVLGKIGQYGHGMITKRANAMLDEFAACARTKLEAPSESSGHER